MLGCDTPREVSSSRIQLHRPVAQLEVEALAAMPPVEEGEKLQPKLVDLSQLDPGLRFDIRYAGVARLVVRPVAHRDRLIGRARDTLGFRGCRLGPERRGPRTTSMVP